ncbi:nitroreductase family protein [Paenibacillus hunanensis]|uniref:Oxidoreductase (Fatty acid repression mutant protein) n=1 Tax=Paenibacillus hunanensis TaxID=539262 RepID=A0ABU1J4T9_9BACL|nr:nitroreductase family protein [Paenibacillus hunanensis]MDR6246527.1 putative oxidoreductase (fatty acid repression mutant protein) [Paenibacillus hunanensis]GGJ04036.1 nitroreductase [Paenibacillus hunanensis]
MSTEAIFEAMKKRRSIYGISKEAVTSDERIQEIVEQVVLHTPSAFNSQTARIIILLGEKHDQLWDYTANILKEIVPADSFEPTQQKMDSFKAGYGTILFFEDEAVIRSMQDQFQAYQDKFPVWSQQANGMHQYLIWTLLEAEGYGASLQHYNPLIDEKIKAEWDIPESWTLVAQMPFGKPTAPAGDKEFKPLEERIRTLR